MTTILKLTLIALIGSSMALIAVEWVVGCGETYTDSTGTTRPNQCVFINRGVSQ